jgi:hypothetical protein
MSQRPAGPVRRQGEPGPQQRPRPGCRREQSAGVAGTDRPGDGPLMHPPAQLGMSPPQIAGPPAAPGRRWGLRRACYGLAAVILGAASGLATLVGMGLAVAVCCAGPVLAAGAAAGSAAAGVGAAFGWRLGLVWAAAPTLGLAALWLRRRAARPGPRCARTGRAPRASADGR